MEHFYSILWSIDLCGMLGVFPCYLKLMFNLNAQHSALGLDCWCLMMFTGFPFESSNMYFRRHKCQPLPHFYLNFYSHRPWDTFCTFCKASAVLQVHL